MTYTQHDVDEIIYSRCLPEDCHEVLASILEIEDEDELCEELNIFTGNCYRFEPNHPRYDRNRALFPRCDS